MSDYVFVLNGDGQPLSPCHPSVARKLLKQGKAVVERVIPFTIRLKETKAGPIVQAVSIGIDDGVKTAGVAAVQHNRDGDRVVFKAEIKLRSNVKKLLGFRRSRRRGRRSRLRCREPRWRRGDKTGWISPSVRTRKDNVLRAVRDLAKMLPVSRIVYEEGQFDTRSLWDEQVEDYQRGPNSGFENRRKAVLWRDKYICQYCGADCIKDGLVTEVDHVIPRSRGGTNAWKNLVCSCRQCNQAKGSQTAAEFGYPRVRGAIFVYPAWLQQGKTYIKGELRKTAPVEVWYGWQTANRRKELGLEKSHINDAVSLAALSDKVNSTVGKYMVIARRRRDNMQNGNGRSRWGFTRGDIVRYEPLKGNGYIAMVSGFNTNRRAINCLTPLATTCNISAGRLQIVKGASSLVYLPTMWRGTWGQVKRT